MKIILEEHNALGQVFKNTLRNKVTVYILQLLFIENKTITLSINLYKTIIFIGHYNLVRTGGPVKSKMIKMNS